MTGWSYEEFVERFADSSEPMATVTDEELCVLTPSVPAAERWIPLSVLDELAEDDRRIAMRTAYRSLLARGIVAPRENLAPASGAAALEVRGPLVPVLELLGASWPLVLMTRRCDGLDTTQLLLNLAGRLVLLQDVRDGVHRFWLLHAATACHQLAAALDPLADTRDAAAADLELIRGPAMDPPASWAPLHGRLRDARARGQVIALRRGATATADLAFQVASLDDGPVVVMGAAPDEHGDATEVVARRLSPAAVLGLAVEALGLSGTEV